MGGAFYSGGFWYLGFNAGTPIVLPATYQSNRADLNAALGALIQAFIQDQSYAIGRVFWSELPDSLTGEGPMIVLGDITETIQHTGSIRITTFTGAIWYIDWLTDRQELNARVSVWADHMRDLFTANPHVVNANSELHQTGLTEGELSQGQIVMSAPQLSYVCTIQEGYR